ncbi:NAD(P)H-dependent glycerol-3-phosphate dehydrogenase [Sphingomonas sp. TZW2008]|uniref:NAD(P)H-dependent glycerol-3-phosphate dehydrogenase n=1 Tax=Sphingomonas sp. TZW2008 TaxID=1917973 RepID=UPI000A271DD1|nr:NAD(P)H-dependent glycerol-3-phosphate dehydrogenase [Sphingomonas sp. TZW2008]
MRIGVIGGGAWGTALAQVAARDADTGDASSGETSGGDVLLWAREADVVAAINDRHENIVFLPGVPLSPAIRATDALDDLAACDALLVVAPAQHVGAVLAQLPAGETPLVLCAKGIEAGTRRLVSEVAQAAHPRAPIAVLSGPTFAHEVAAGLPTAVTLACADPALQARLAARLASPGFRPYASSDVVGAEIGGAVKNVLAIACGVVDGAGLGQNARAALIARGFAEMTRFGIARGARPETLAGLSGLGDLVLTCSSTSSRNFSLGLGLGRGGRAPDLLADRRTVAEGAFTAPVLAEAAADVGIDMPITAAVCRLLDGAPARDVIEALLARPLREEA